MRLNRNVIAMIILHASRGFDLDHFPDNRTVSQIRQHDIRVGKRTARDHAGLEHRTFAACQKDRAAGERLLVADFLYVEEHAAALRVINASCHIANLIANPEYHLGG